jgi:hypothetical protein
MAWLVANWVNVAVGILALAEVVSLFIPGSNGTLAGVIAALKGLPGVKDPGIGGQ